MKKAEIIIENLKCHGCASTIQKGLLKFDEVEKVDINIEESIIGITYDETKGNLDNYKKKLSTLGYPEAGNNDTISVVKSYVSCAIGKVGADKKSFLKN